jgi:glycosyltransferase involved in cell wall biosynthesis
MEQPLISIIIPVYNGEKYLREAIDSALSQTYPNIEVIVVNDGSIDDTEQIALSYGKHIRYYSKKNGGVSTALNLGIEQMCGEYFSWLAHDDMYALNKLELQWSVLMQNNDKTAIVHGNYDLLDTKNHIVSHMVQEESYTIEQLTNSVFPLLMSTLHGCTPLIHKSHLTRIGVFNENLPLTQDYDFMFRAFRGQRTLFVSEPLLTSRLRDDSGKSDSRFMIASSKQYEGFARTLTYDEVKHMFKSPRAFYSRMVAVIKARKDTPSASEIYELMDKLPAEVSDAANSDLIERFKENSSVIMPALCIFGVGFHGKILNYELAHRGIMIDCFCDNNASKHGTNIDGVHCVSLNELEQHKSDMLVIVAADVSDSIVAQLKSAGFKYITTKKSLDALILAYPPTI